ncbi:MAG: GDP-L-fucose synthase [Pseudomonadaceae bacterium]|nr:GDP-L-fucose synthase [Pseudomonadaceae bacterium]
MPLDKTAKIYVAGHGGLIGSALLRELASRGHTNIITRTRKELDLTDYEAVKAFFEAEKPAYVILAAAKVGGIVANKTHPGDFILDNLKIQTNVIENAWKNGCQKFLFLGSSCIYPKEAQQPITEDALLTGPLEPTNDAYAVAKISGIMLGQCLRRQYGWDFISGQPTNLYGLEDNFHPEHAHVIPGMMTRMDEAKRNGDAEFKVWGTGKPMREFLYADDCARALVTMLESYSDLPILNVGTGQDITIRELAETMKEVVGFEGELVFDTTRPDGMFRKVLDISRLKALGFTPQVQLRDGLTRMYTHYTQNRDTVRRV